MAQSSDEDDDQIDEEGPVDGVENYPLDELLIRTEVRSIQDVLRRISRDQIILDPDFQRDFVWAEDRQSKLIESVLMRIPLQVFYFAEDPEGNLIVVDGLQRLTTLGRFYSGALTLDLPSRSELHQRRFARISQKLQTRFEDGQLTFYIIGAKVPERVRLDIFERVNAGVPLTRQQMRNALYNGPATALLRTLAMSEELAAATGGVLSIPDAKAKMRDREAVNRFLAYFQLGWREYVTPAAPESADYDEFLGRVLRELNGKSKDDSVARAHRERAETAFRASMELNRQVFGKHAFRKSLAGDDSGKRSSFSLALFDVFSATLARYSGAPNTVLANAARLREVVRSLFGNMQFVNAITYATAAFRSVQARFTIAEDALKEVLGDPPA